MKKSKLTLLSLLLLGSVSLTSCSFKLSDLFKKKTDDNTSGDTSGGGQSGNVIDDNFGDYYSSITDSMSGSTLLNALNTLNNQKRQKTIGYKSHRYWFKYTEVDWTGKENKTGKMFGFYDNAVIADHWDNEATWNHEHTWPNSHGGGEKGDTSAPYVEDDIHMVRPASKAQNEGRGNSFYGHSIYDPGQYVADYRGVAARIIFYCAIADTQLTIVDQNDGGGHHMGKLSELLKWNLEYAPDKSETATLAKRIEANRNKEIYSREGLQGNRNPFIDHPEYACRIWGTTNSTTKSICGIK